MDLEKKISFLSSTESYPHPTKQVHVLETHMSFVFLTDDRVYKMKKPVFYPFLDYRELQDREFFCREEVRLNRRLAKEVYLGCIPLRMNDSGELSFGTGDEIVEWLVEMVRLPENDMLDYRISNRAVSPEEVHAVADKLSKFYARQSRTKTGGSAYLRHLDEEAKITAAHLRFAQIHLNRTDLDETLNNFDQNYKSVKPEIRRRIQTGVIVEGHGDLRPEHVCLTSPPIVFDCLEFDEDMRFIDPYDELNYLGEECARLGAPWIREILLGVLDRQLDKRPSEALLKTFGAFRMLLRARLSIDHLLDADQNDPSRWIEKAHSYLDIARNSFTNRLEER